ncbi:hypothetical protein [Pseudonocardia sp. TRM90224]|uniref:hypothetical protein n=1 Tax=Pseudonocardia sp. TRM90224 TaxID=2812678 RepID=UPI001E4762D8|nr:hypothetical protein [Pseudonocardia sp. TRM90224]
MGGTREGQAAEWWGRWPVWTAYAAVGGSLAYAVAGTHWALGGGGFPFGAADLDAADNGDLLAGVTPQAAGPVITALGVAGALAGWAMLRRTRIARPLVLAVGIGLAVLLAVVLPESRAVKWMPPLGLLGFLRPPSGSTVQFLVLMLLGFVWAGAMLAYWRATRGACATCGRSGRPDDPRWARWGRIVTYVAIVAPFGYALVRVGWAMGVPIGVPPEFLERINAANPGNTTMILELALAGFATGGALLTVGLLRPWGTRFPRWLGGRPVPVAFPVAFAGTVAVSLTAFGLSMAPDVVRFFAGGMHAMGYRMGLLWALPPVAILVWGLSLGAATWAYHRRRRTACKRCGQGDPIR